MFYILNLCEIIYWFIRVVPFNYSPHTHHMLYIKKTYARLSVCMKHSCFSCMGRSWSYLDLPKQSWYYFWFSSSGFQAPEDSQWHVPPCFSEVCHFLACLLSSSLHADMNPKSLLLIFFLNQKYFWQFDLQNAYFKACSWVFLYLIPSLQFREIH